MKSFFATAAILILAAGAGNATIHTITNAGNTFSPSTLTIELGDTVNFSISTLHTVVEVSQATWNSNGDAPLPGGFSRGAGGGIVVITTQGVHYYVCGVHNLSSMKGTITVNPVTDVGPTTDPTPASFSLTQNYPNPFNPSTTVSFVLPKSAYTEITVFSSLGEEMRVLVAEVLPAGVHSATWDGTDAKGRAVVTGAYYFRMLAGTGGSEYAGTTKVLLVR